jgi:ankyrin repeat protein
MPPPLHVAAACGNVRALKEILRGVDFASAERLVNERDSDGNTALDYAARWGREAAVNLLVDFGADVYSGSALLLAAKYGHAGVVVSLLLYGADANARPRRHGKTALHLAAAGDHADAVGLLLVHGARADAKVPGTGATALHLAAKSICGLRGPELPFRVRGSKRLGAGQELPQPPRLGGLGRPPRQPQAAAGVMGGRRGGSR